MARGLKNYMIISSIVLVLIRDPMQKYSSASIVVQQQ
jgi:hypothetical protein